MKSKATDPLNTIPQPLLRWIESQTQLPESVIKAATFYEAARAARTISWRRRLDHFVVLHTWATIALIADERTRKYMSELIRDETEGLHWTIHAGAAARVAMDELEVANATPPARLFRQRRDAAIKGLRAARENLAALEADFPLRDLLIGPDVRKFRRAVEQFTHADFSRRRDLGHLAREQAIAAGASSGEVMAASFSGLLKVHGNRVPHLSKLLRAAETAVCNMGEPSTDRHSARSQYLREMYSAMKHSAIESRRIAFLTYASEAVFGEHIERRDMRRLVADLVNAEKEESKFTTKLAAQMEAIDAET